jgi:zinc transport system substrate-binding protein
MPFISSAERGAEREVSGRLGKLLARVLISVLLLLFSRGFSLSVGSSEKMSPPPGEGTGAFVGIPPLSSLVRHIGGDRISVHVLVQPGQDPHTFEPTPKQMAALNDADVYFAIGLPFEERILEKLRGMNPDLVVVRTDEGVTRRTVEDAPHAQGNIHGAEKGEPDPHLWLGPAQLEVIARNVFGGLAEIDPDGAQEYRDNLDLYLKNLHALDERLNALLEPYRGRSLFVYHPAFGYFADAYGLIQVPVEIEGKQPTPKQIEQLIQRMRRENARFIFVSPQFDRKTAKVMAEAIDGSVITVDPLAEDVLANLQRIASILDESLRTLD